MHLISCKIITGIYLQASSPISTTTLNDVEIFALNQDGLNSLDINKNCKSNDKQMVSDDATVASRMCVVYRAISIPIPTNNTYIIKRIEYTYNLHTCIYLNRHIMTYIQ